MSVQIYPVSGKELRHDGYEVKVNGKPVALDAARVSAIPFNRRWPGHQRTMDQTEMINFLSLATDEPVTFEIMPKAPFETVEIRPASLGITPEIEGGVIRFTLEKPAYFTVEPYGRQNALHIFADPLPCYDVDPADKNVIYFGPGIHEPGQIELKSNQTLFLDEGAVVYACVSAKDATNIRILGRGILDNSHNHEKILFEVEEDPEALARHEAIRNAKRQYTVELEYCENIRIDGITIRDSLVYNIRPVACRDVKISHAKVIGCWRYNSDGFDMHNCENVTIENCFLRTYDDCICVKGFDCYYTGDIAQMVREAMQRNGRVYDTFRHVRVRNCVLWNDWGKCLEIGAETKAEEMCDVIFEDCDVIHTTHTVLDCMNVDYADVHDITWRNIRIQWDDVNPQPMYQTLDSTPYCPTDPDYAPYVIVAQVVYHHEYSAGSTRQGKNRNLVFENIQLTGRQQVRFKFEGFDAAHQTRDVVVRNFTVNGKPLTKEQLQLTTNEFCENIRIEY